MGTLKKWKNLSKLGSQPPLKSAYPGSCRPKKLFLGRFFLENHFFDPFRPNEDPQVLYMAGKLWISSLWWYKEKNIFLHPVERMIFYDGPHRYFPLHWEAVIVFRFPNNLAIISCNPYIPRKSSTAWWACLSILVYKFPFWVGETNQCCDFSF